MRSVRGERANFTRLVLGWLAGKPDYPQKLKVPEGYEKVNEKSNTGRGTVDGFIAKESFTRTMYTSFSAVSKPIFASKYAFE